MRIPGTIPGLGGLCLIILMTFAAPAHAERDVMLVLDNSGSMRVNDPSRLSISAVDDFIRAQAPDARVGVVVFADSPRLVQPLTPVASGRQSLLASLSSLDFSGQWTDTASAVERALYELRLNGREDVERAVILMTDGIIDTGAPERDFEKARWLRDRLTEQARDENIRIFGIAFTERADFQLLQSIAQATDGEYFRALQPDDISPVMSRIDRVVGFRTPATQSPVHRESEAEPPGTAQQEARQPGVQPEGQTRAERLVFTPPAASSSSSSVLQPPREEGVNGQEPSSIWRWILIVLALLVLGAVAVAMQWGDAVVRLLKRSAGFRRAPKDEGPKAVLYDVYDPSDIKRHELSGRPVVIGRVSGSDPAMDYVVVDERTVGRWHATIERRGQSFWIRDEGSVNGTYVNDHRVTSEHPLKHGDMVRVHRHEFEFVIPELFDSDRTMMSPEAKVRKPGTVPEGV